MLLSAVFLSALGLGVANAPAHDPVRTTPRPQETNIAQIEGLNFDDVVGHWTLTLSNTTNDSIRAIDTGRPSRPIVEPLVVRRTAQRLQCTLGGNEKRCYFNGRRFVIDSTSPDGGSLVYMLTRRTETGFAGRAHLRVNYVRSGQLDFGEVTMTRNRNRNR